MGKDKHHPVIEKTSKTLAAVAVAGGLAVGTDLGHQNVHHSHAIVAHAAEVKKGATTDNLNLRKGAGTSYGVIKVLPKGTQVEILKEKNGWLQVKAAGKEGWVSAQYVKKTTATPAKQQPSVPSKPAAKGSGTTTANLNLRKGAGTSYGVIKVLPKGTKLEILGQQSGWLQIKALGEQGWVKAEYVNQGGSPQAAPSTPAPQKEKTGTTTENLNLRKGAGTSYGVVKVLPKGTAVTIVKQSGNWLQVKALGLEGWVSADYVSQGGSPSKTAANSTYNTLLSSVTSYYTVAEAARSSNVELAANKINGLVLQPGQSYSFTKQVGPVTVGNGYQLATVFSGSDVSTGIGGGICQVSSTLYYAQLKAGIANGERHNHSRAVGYVPLGLDATMWEGSLDHTFTNPYKVPIQLVATAGGGVLTIEIRANGDALGGYTYEPRTELVSKSGNTETWDTYLQTYKNGAFVSEKYLHRSTYVMW
ncbi:MAG: SH3 domain-containing protein [Turicibacter sp.]|nr:SH3 domain-containing protein [Turicibacter sp.]